MQCRSARSGQLRRNLAGDKAYFSFLPTSLPPNPPIRMDAETATILCRIHMQVGFLKGLEEGIPDLSLFLGMYARKEALFSSQIEGTQATLEDVLNPMLAPLTSRDIADAIDNVNAVFFAIDAIRSARGLPLCMRLLRKTHRVLLEHTRGKDKNPGQFRTTQNWIGPAGCTLKTASYVPPNPADMDRALAELETFIHSDTLDLDPFVKAGLIHYQFETIHPFLDGNGRIGRLLILLYLIHARVFTSPVLYISYFLKRHRDEYYEAMTAVRCDGDYEGWIRLFLRAVNEALADAIDSAQKLLALHKKSLQTIEDATSGKVAQRRRVEFLKFLEHHPIVDIKTMTEMLSLSFPTASKTIETFIELGILQETTGRHRGRIFAFQAYLDILRKDDEPIRLS